MRVSTVDEDFAAPDSDSDVAEEFDEVRARVQVFGTS